LRLKGLILALARCFGAKNAPQHDMLILSSDFVKAVRWRINKKWTQAIAESTFSIPYFPISTLSD